MNQRGFFTMVGLCLLIVATIFIKGIQEFETNYSRGVTNFQAEHELQNAADSALIEAAENLPEIAENEIYNFPIKKLTSQNLKNVTVERHAKNTYLKKFIRRYSSGSNYIDIDAGESPQKVTVIISVASCDSPFIVGKMYRRALAYILDDDETTEDVDESKTIHFMNDL